MGKENKKLHNIERENSRFFGTVWPNPLLILSLQFIGSSRILSLQSKEIKLDNNSFSHDFAFYTKKLNTNVSWF